jgi:hypothetical protein
MKDECARRKIGEWHRMKPASSGAVIEPLLVKLSVDGVGSASGPVEL